MPHSPRWQSVPPRPVSPAFKRHERLVPLPRDDEEDGLRFRSNPKGRGCSVRQCWWPPHKSLQAPCFRNSLRILSLSSLPVKMAANFFDPAQMSKWDVSDKSTNQPLIRRVCIALTIIVAIPTVLRAYTRLFIVRRFSIDDGLILLAVLTFFATVGVIVYEMRYGFGNHIWTFDLSTILPVARKNISLATAHMSLVAASVALTKMAIISLYLSIFPQKKFRISMWIILALIIISSLLHWIFTPFACAFKQLDSLFGPPKPGFCINLETFSYFRPSMSLITDLMLWIAPIPIIWRMNMPTAKRLTLAGLFALGFFASCCAVAVLICLKESVTDSDPTYVGVYAILWSLVEAAVGIVCAIVPSLKPLVRKICPNMTFLRSRSSRNRPSYLNGSLSRMRGQTGKQSTTDGQKDVQEEISITQISEAQSDVELGIVTPGSNFHIQSDVSQLLEGGAVLDGCSNKG